MSRAWFSSRLINWYSDNKRNLPWRNTKDPYKVWLSEIILQQTRVEQGLPYYDKFISTFPTVFDLANAKEDLVLRCWQGLGYYSRAKNLHSAAKYVVNELKGEFPNSYVDLLKLKGVGTYTAAAIASFCFGEIVPVVDGNVYRVLSRIFNDSTDISSGKGNKHFFSLAKQLIDVKNPALFNQSIMEFGALYCTPKSYNCEQCIYHDKCEAFAHKTVSVLPYKKSKTKVKELYLHLCILSHKGNIHLLKRDDSSIWKGLYEFPSYEGKEFDENAQRDFFKTLNIEPNKEINQLGEVVIHKLSHRKIYATFYEVEIKNTEDLSGFSFYNLGEIKELPKPVLIDRILHEYYF